MGLFNSVKPDNTWIERWFLPFVHGQGQNLIKTSFLENIYSYGN